MLMTWRHTLSRLGSQSISNYVTDARQFFKWAQEAGIRADNPAARIPAPRAGRRLPRPVSTADMSVAIEHAPERIRPWLALAGLCGLRCKEIALLRREYIFDRADEPYLLVAADATKGTDERTVPLPPAVLRELQRAGMPRAGWMFTRRDDRPGPNAPYVVSSVAARYLREIIDATLHQFRHWYGTKAYEVDHDLLGVADLMGHRDLRSTRIYAQVSQVRKARIVAGMPVPAALQMAA
jgi:integrase